MHQITNQQLIKLIPKSLTQWNQSDVYKWLTLNHVNIDLQKLRENKVNGLKMMRMEIKQWKETYGLSKFISGQILDWLDQQALQFQNLLEDDRQNKKIGSADGWTKQKQILDDQKQIHQHIQQMIPILLKLSQVPSNPSSQQQIQIQQKQQQSTEEPPLAQQHESLQQDDNLSQDQSNESLHKAFCQNEQQNSQLESDIDQNMKDNIKVDRNMSDNEQIDVSQIDIDMQIQKHNTSIIHNQNPILNQNIQKQSKIHYDDGNEVKGMKKNKCHPRSFNERLKAKNNQSNVNVIEKIKQNCLVKRLNSPEQFPVQIKPLTQKVQNIKSKSKNYKIQNPHIKFVATEFMQNAPEASENINTFQKKLKIKTENFEAVVIGNAKIGRAKGNLVLFQDESVSRNHAQISSKFTNSGKIRFLLKDVGSRFGTYVECRGSKQIIVGKSYLIGSSEVQVLTVELVKPYSCSQLSRTKTTFNIKLRLDKQKILNFSNKLHVSIGKGNSADFEIDNVCSSAKIWLEKEKKIMIEGIDGKLYEKLVQNSQWDIQTHLNTLKQVQVIFGWMKTTLEVIEICVVCNRTPLECSCKK